MRISVLIPAFNEEGNIQKTIDLYAQVLQAITSAFEVIVVNDGSTDATRTILEDLAKARPYLKAYHHPFNKGMGAAIKTGVVHDSMSLFLRPVRIFNLTRKKSKNFFHWQNAPMLLPGIGQILITRRAEGLLHSSI